MLGLASVLPSDYGTHDILGTQRAVRRECGDESICQRRWPASGWSIPSIARKAVDLARESSPAYLFNHTMRTYLFASLTGRALGQRFDEELLFLACTLHDLGLTERFQGDLPFELQGAEAARAFS